MRRGLGRTPMFSVGWHNAIFEHYRITDEASVAALLPAGTQLDRHSDGNTYLSVVSFLMADMRWLPAPLRRATDSLPEHPSQSSSP